MEHISYRHKLYMKIKQNNKYEGLHERYERTS